MSLRDTIMYVCRFDEHRYFYRLLIFNQHYMKPYTITIYQQMQENLARYIKGGNCFINDIEQCFQLANLHWNKVKKKLNTYRFKNEENEIEFFKTIKPRFTSEIEYYSFLYHSLIFEPDGTDAAIDFWSREYGRLQRFEEDNKSFLLCYQDDGCEMTPYYFLCKYYVPKNALDIKMYDAGTTAITNGDHLVACFLALKRYQPYAKKQLESLSKRNSV